MAPHNLPFRRFLIAAALFVSLLYLFPPAHALAQGQPQELEAVQLNRAEFDGPIPGDSASTEAGSVTTTAYYTYLPAVFYAGSYYVAPDGDDANPGTRALPWRTVSRAAAAVEAGRTVVFKSGVYDVPADQKWPSGEPGQWVAFRGEGDVVLRQARNGDVVVIDGAYLGFEGITFSGRSNRYALYLVRLQGAEYITFRNCKFVDTNGHGLGIFDASHVTIADSLISPEHTEYGAREGVVLAGAYTEYITIRDTEVRHTGHTGIDIEGGAHVTIDNCHIHDTSSHGIELATYGDGGTINDVVIKNSDIHDTGLWVSDDPATHNKNAIRIVDAGSVTIEGNDIYDHGLAGVFVESLTDGPIYIRGNTFRNCNLWDAGWVLEGYGYVHVYYTGGTPPKIYNSDNEFYVTDTPRRRLYWLTEERMGRYFVSDHNLFVTETVVGVTIGGESYATIEAYREAGYEPHSVIE
jgi:hypothetical protein